jgi:hypothetical protein
MDAAQVMRPLTSAQWLCPACDDLYCTCCPYQRAATAATKLLEQRNWMHCEADEPIHHSCKGFDNIDHTPAAAAPQMACPARLLRLLLQGLLLWLPPCWRQQLPAHTQNKHHTQSAPHEEPGQHDQRYVTHSTRPSCDSSSPNMTQTHCAGSVQRRRASGYAPKPVPLISSFVAHWGLYPYTLKATPTRPAAAANDGHGSADRAPGYPKARLCHARINTTPNPTGRRAHENDSGCIRPQGLVYPGTAFTLQPYLLCIQAAACECCDAVPDVRLGHCWDDYLVNSTLQTHKRLQIKAQAQQKHSTTETQHNKSDTLGELGLQSYLAGTHTAIRPDMQTLQCPTTNFA